MFSTSLFAFCAGICLQYHLRFSWYFHWPWPEEIQQEQIPPRGWAKAASLHRCLTHSPASQTAAGISVFAGNRAHMSAAAMCYRTGKPIRKMAKRTQNPTCHLLQDFSSWEYLFWKKLLLRLQKFCVIWYSMQEFLSCERLSYGLVWHC